MSMNLRRYLAISTAVLVLLAFQAFAHCKTPPAIKTVRIGAGRVFHVNGKPFFPIMTWLQDAKNFPAAKACGVNTTAGYWPKSSGTKDVTGYIKLVEAAGLYGVMPFDAGLKDNRSLLGYIHSDEPDLPRRGGKAPRMTPEQTLVQYKKIKAADPSRPVFMTFTGYFLPFFKKFNDAELARYPQYVKAADVVGYDIYPIYGWNKPQWIHLVHDGTKRLAELAGDKPVYTWIETSRGGQWTGPLKNQKEVTPTHIRAEVWMAICRGATAIGYFTHVWKPSYNQFGVPAKNRKALAEINAQITRLAPEILSAAPKQPVTLQASGDVKVDVMARATPSGMTVFAVNYDERLKQAKAVIKVDGLPAGTKVTVVDENRTVTSQAGSFTDNFAPLTVHIYRVGIAPKNAHKSSGVTDIVAHRGASRDAPENTIAAFELAWKQGADAIEGDFYLTKDRRIVCIHDSSTKRTARANLSVAKSTLAELRKLDVGKWRGAEWTGQRIPTLREVLAIVPAGKTLLIEIKCGPEIIPVLKKVLDSSRLADRQTIIISFNAKVIADSKKQLPKHKAFWLTSLRKDKKTQSWSTSRQKALATLKKIKADGLDCQANPAAIDRTFMSELRSQRLELHVWTVDNVKTAMYFQQLGASSITTNRPAWLREQMTK